MSVNVPILTAALLLLSTSGVRAADTLRTTPTDSPAVTYTAVDRFPYPTEAAIIPVPAEYRYDSEHYIICEATIGADGGVVSVRALGCEGEKGPLCDRVEAYLPKLTFAPARRAGHAVAATVVFPVLFPPAPDSEATFGPPVVGTWSESRCDYDTRIYGAEELPAAERPVVRKRGEATFPALARLQGKSGEAIINMIVDPDGVPCFVLCEAVRPVGDGFAEAAVRAAWEYRFIPGRLDDKPQAVWVKIPFRWQQ